MVLLMASLIKEREVATNAKAEFDVLLVAAELAKDEHNVVLVKVRDELQHESEARKAAKSWIQCRICVRKRQSQWFICGLSI